MKAPFKTINEELKKNKIFFDNRFNSDYDFLLHYFKITQPKKILIAGGFSNCDFFYAVQGCDHATEVVNYDSTTEPIAGKIDFLKNYFDYKGSYTYINEPIDYDKLKNESWDLIWDNHTSKLQVHIQDYKNIPLIYTHWGHPQVFLRHFYIIDQYTPMNMLSRNIGYFGLKEEQVKTLLSISESNLDTDEYHESRVKELELPYNNKQTVYHVAHCNTWEKALNQTS